MITLRTPKIVIYIYIFFTKYKNDQKECKFWR